jgi:isopentenyl-diphosphate delta-isomerase
VQDIKQWLHQSVNLEKKNVMNEQVSFDDEKLIVVDEDDNVLDYMNKKECHVGGGILHRAFSIFIFNSQKQLLLQKRSGQKQLWPHFWSNSCCSHPRKGENDEAATQRRLREELDLETQLHYLFKFIYHVPYHDIGSEFELCSVYIGKSDSEVTVNPNEIEEWKFIDTGMLDKELSSNAEIYSPWFRMEWKEMREIYQSEIDRLFA